MLRKVSAYCRNHDYRAYCQECGLETEVNYYGESGTVKTLCDSFYNKKAAEVPEKVIENMPLGILGAFIGSLIG